LRSCVAGTDVARSSFDEDGAVCHGERVMTLVGNLDGWSTTIHVVVDQRGPRGSFPCAKDLEIG